MLLLQELSTEWQTQDDTTHTQNQWTAKGVMSLQPEQSGHTQLHKTSGQNALKAIAQIHIQTQGGAQQQIHQLSYGPGGKWRSSTYSNLVSKMILIWYNHTLVLFIVPKMNIITFY